MSRLVRSLDLRRCARGHITNAGAATHTTAALTNNSNAAELILVWQVVYGLNFSGEEIFSYQQLPVMGTLGTSAPLVPGDAPPPGILSTGDQPAQFPFDWNMSFATFAQYWPATFPFAVIPPGWSLVVQESGTPTNSIDLNFFWEAIRAPEFERWYAGHVEVL